MYAKLFCVSKARDLMRLLIADACSLPRCTLLIYTRYYRFNLHEFARVEFYLDVVVCMIDGICFLLRNGDKR